MLHETASAESAWAREPKSPELAGTTPELIAWGADASSDILCWDVSGADPSTWNPLGDLALWGTQPATFLNEREEERRLKQGLDPWTGEPDPYAGMYGA